MNRLENLARIVQKSVARLLQFVLIGAGILLPFAAAPAYANGTQASELPNGMSVVSNLREGGFEVEARGDLYLVRRPGDGEFLEVVEKLPQGGLGRILRYRGRADDGGWVDLEFLYEDRANRVTVLDHGQGRFYRMTFTERRPDPFSVFPAEEKETREDEILGITSDGLKFIPVNRVRMDAGLPDGRFFRFEREASSGPEAWQSRLVRGPPEGVALR